jgi:hypothetical protein
MPKAPVVTARLAAPAATPVPARPGALQDQEAQNRIAELRARGDDHAASLQALEDRLAVLQKQAELLKAQLEQVAQAEAKAAAAASAVPVAATGAPSAESASSSGAAPSAAATAQTSAAQSARKTRGLGDLLLDWRVLAGGLGAILVAALAYKLGRRKQVKPAQPQAGMISPAATVPSWQVPTSAAESARKPFDHERTQQLRAAPSISDADRTVEWNKAGGQPMQPAETVQWDARPPTTSNLPVQAPAAATDTQPGVAITRDFHITQQFQPVNERAVALSTPEEIVQQARTHYMDDGDTFRAIDLLEMAVSVRTDSSRPWQALFAIYRRENMPERFQRLALAYRQAFGEDSNWAPIQAMGYALDANNPLYTSAAGADPIPEDLLERWLGVPLDFTAHLLANEMHDQLMETIPGRAKKRKRVAGE